MVECWFIPLFMCGIWVAVRARGWVYRLQTFRPRRRHEAGLCARCGYDVRGMTDRCPECGQDLAQQARAYASDRDHWS